MSFAANIDDVVAENHSKLLGKHPAWERVRLREVASVLNGFPFESSRFSKSEGAPLIRIRDILPGRTETFYQGDVDETFLVKRGEILVGMDGDFNCAEWPGKPALLNQRVCKITPNAEFYSRRFLLHALPGYLAAINEQTSSITVKHLSSRTVESIPLPLPPRAEQERIVAKLDALLSRLAAGEAAARRAQERLKRYRASVLHAAVTGELTRDWRKTHKPEETGAQLLKRLLTERRARWEAAELKRLHVAGKPPKDDKWKKRYPVPRACRVKEDEKLPRGWTWASIEQTSMRVTVGHVGPMKMEYVEHGIPFLRSQNIRANRFDPDGLLYIRRSFHEQLAKSKVFPGDVAVVRSGNVGTTCVIPESLGEANCADLVLVQRPLINSNLLSFYMNSAAQKHVAAPASAP
ncbi:MAG: restriction endonuclease subunit S [Verrucomicrobiae bacterium]|nr:restriction endonuclease subunit S [Verrucomicrobiae bacterium]